MGIFSQNIRPGLYGETVEAAYGYGKADAGAKIKLEGYQNDMALFTAIIESDFNAAKAEHEGAVQEASVITEGTIGNIFTKIKEMLKKLWEKIKGMIQSFMVKFVAVFVRDNKELVKKYHKQIVKQMTDSKRKYTEMEFKMTEGYYKYLTGSDKGFDSMELEAIFDIYSGKAVKGASLEEAKDNIDKDIISSLNTAFSINMSEISELKKELDDKYIGEKDSYEGYTSAINGAIENELTNGGKTVKTLERDKSTYDKKFRVTIKNCDDRIKKADSMDEKNNAKELETRNANAAYYKATQLQNICTEVASWRLSFQKAYLKEVRGLYIKAVSRRATNESADILDDIIDEAVDYDVESMFEADVEADLNDDDLSAELDSIDQLSKDEKCGEGCRK